jgi:hypothetical protein
MRLAQAIGGVRHDDLARSIGDLEERVFRQIFAAAHHSVGVLIVERAHNFVLPDGPPWPRRAGGVAWAGAFAGQADGGRREKWLLPHVNVRVLGQAVGCKIDPWHAILQRQTEDRIAL